MVGFILKVFEECLGSLVLGFLGFVWLLVIYFVVLILVVEDVGFIEVFKCLFSIIWECWGEFIGVGFSLGLFVLVGIVLFIVLGFVFGYLIYFGIGVLVGFLIFMLMLVVNGVVCNVFLIVVYEYV